MTEPSIRRGPIELWACDGVSVRIGSGPGPDGLDEAVERRWAELLAGGSRFFDAPVVAVDSFDPETGRVEAHLDSYKRLAVQPQVNTGVMALAVAGVVLALDASGREHLLLIRRDERVRLYGGMWETGPAGGVDPAPDQASLGFDELVAQLRRELAEEAGLDEALDSARVAGVLVDHLARTVDVVIEARLSAGVDELRARAGDLHWDASETRWVAREELAAFVARHGVTEATVSLLEMTGWLEQRSR